MTDKHMLELYRRLAAIHVELRAVQGTIRKLYIVDTDMSISTIDTVDITINRTFEHIHDVRKIVRPYIRRDEAEAIMRGLEENPTPMMEQFKPGGELNDPRGHTVTAEQFNEDNANPKFKLHSLDDNLYEENSDERN